MDTAKTGAYLASLRKAAGMTQQDAADRLGVSNKTVSKWKSGGGFPDITVLPALAELYGNEVAESTTIQYGGSMNEKNAADLLSKPNVDGGLIGGASLVPAKFTAIVDAAQ